MFFLFELTFFGEGKSLPDLSATEVPCLMYILGFEKRATLVDLRSTLFLVVE
jgi:hypothetical protein